MNSAVLEEIYAAGLRPGRWPSVLSRLSHQFGGAGIGLHPSYARPGSAYGTARDPVWMRLYRDHYHKLDPWAQVLERDLVVGQPTFVPAPLEDFRRSEYYCDFLRPQRLAIDSPILLLLDRAGGTPAGAMAVFSRCGSPPLETADLDTLRELAPHLQRAIAVTRRVLDLEGQVEALGNVLDELRVALALLDGAGCILRANAPFRALAGPGGPLHLGSDGVRLVHSPESETFSSSIQLAARGDSEARGSIVRIPRTSGLQGSPDSGSRDLVAHVIPVSSGTETAEWLGDPRCRVCLWIVDPEDRRGASVQLIQQTLGLTRAESRVAESLARGLATEDLARALGITLNTARSYVKQVLFKTGTHNRSELVRLLLSLDPPVGLSH